MTYIEGALLKQFKLPNGNCVDLVARYDGAIQFHERVSFPGSDNCVPGSEFSSGVYISAETAEAAARLKCEL